jgi:hypothetical protein
MKDLPGNNFMIINFSPTLVYLMKFKLNNYNFKLINYKSKINWEEKLI